jgi:hypothetical protein
MLLPSLEGNSWKDAPSVLHCFRFQEVLIDGEEAVECHVGVDGPIVNRSIYLQIVALFVQLAHLEQFGCSWGNFTGSYTTSGSYTLTFMMLFFETESSR